MAAISQPTKADSLLAHLSRRTSSGRFIPEIDGLRFVAIAAVVLFHIGVQIIAYQPEMITSPLVRVVESGKFGVHLFFAISGFVLALPFADQRLRGGHVQSLGAYFWRRVTRIEPPYFVAMTIALLLLSVIGRGATLRELWPHYWASLGYLHNVVFGTMSDINNVAWSLEVEVQFYVVAPLLCVVFAVRESWLRRALLVLTMLVSAGLNLAFPPRLVTLASFVQYFLAGFLIADLYLTRWRDVRMTSHRWDAAALAAFPLLYLTTRSVLGAEGIFPFVVALLFAAAFRGTFTNQVLTNRWLTTVGGMCYSIYLLHFLTIKLLARFTMPHRMTSSYLPNLLVQSAFLVPVVLVVSTAFFVAVERPCMARGWPQRLRAAVQRRRRLSATVEAT